ncbi:hypothetical protein E2P60_06435 [Candidatus Bathyarchaeota archaeon]|nr:hypothetical protein E2P60_06435 [Candidatus Bathyarchaeota archaeon]
MRLTETKNGTVIEVFVKPNQPKFNIKIDGDEIIVFCTEEPVKGKVNKEVIRELSRFFHAEIEMVSGLASKQKRLLIKNMSKSNVESLLHT